MPTLVSRSRGIATATPGRRAILLVFFHVSGFTGDPDYGHFQQASWVRRADLRSFDFLEGDVALSAGWRPATTTSPFFSPRDEAKCVRGPSLQGARCLASGGVFLRLRLDPLTRVDMSVDSASKSACATCVLPGCVGGGTRGASGPHASPTTQTRCVPRESAPEQTSERIRARIRDGQAGIV